jgi:hypothetical protein
MSDEVSVVKIKQPTRPRDKNCKLCGKDCYGTYCRECMKKGHYGRPSYWKRYRRKKDE